MLLLQPWSEMKSLQIGVLGIRDMHLINPNFKLDDLRISSTSNPIL